MIFFLLYLCLMIFFLLDIFLPFGSGDPKKVAPDAVVDDFDGLAEIPAEEGRHLRLGESARGTSLIRNSPPLLGPP